MAKPLGFVFTLTNAVFTGHMPSFFIPKDLFSPFLMFANKKQTNKANARFY